VENQLVLVVLASVVLFGGALVAVMRTDRRREERQQRLEAVTGPTASRPIAGEPVISLRRPLRQRAALGVFALPARLLARLDASLAATGNWIGVPHLVITAVVATLVAVLFATRIMAFGPVVVAVGGGAAAIGAPVLLLRLARARYQRRFLDVLPDAIDLIVRAIRAGLPVVEAMEVAAREIRPPVGVELQRTLEEVRVGVDIGHALQQTADRTRVQEFRFYVVALELQRRTGGGLAETLGNLSTILRRRKEVRLKGRALSAEAKASAAVLAVLPFVVGALLFFFNPALMSVLLQDPRGRFMLGLSFLMLVTGIGVMAMIIRRALRY
jgi:Flp pilus assembly protein TadB